MLFPTLSFGLFFLVVFAFSWGLAARPEPRKLFLIAASYFFYGWWDWRFLGLIIFSSAINYGAGLLLGNTSSAGKRKHIVGWTVAINLGLLGFFKYYGFFLESLSDLLFSLGLERDLPFMEIILPVGISFFTFQGISYIIDVYRGDIPAERSATNLFLYISLFPQLVAGPIVRAAQFMPQLQVKPRLDRALVALGVVLVLAGLFKKMVIANYLATDIVDPVFFDPSAHDAQDLLLAVYGYAVQIYCDFSGYSDIAIGIAALLGYRFRWNFNQPYRAASLQEFWRRWHISLSTWLRDYLYIPLGGSRGGPFKTCRNLFITMLLGGIWHGAAWTFIIWGVMHGGMLILERLAAGAASAGRAAARPGLLTTAVRVFLTFNFVCLAWIFFRATSFSHAMDYLAGLTRWTDNIQYVTPFLVVMVVLSLAAHFLPGELVKRTAHRLESLPILALGALLGLGIFLIEAVAPEGVAPFIYFQF